MSAESQPILKHPRLAALHALWRQRRAGAQVTHALFAIDLPDLGGADKLRAEGITVDALMDFPGH